MSAITSDWVHAETRAPVPPPVVRDKVHRREEEFRSALDSYIAGYVSDQRERRAITAGSIGGATRNRNFTIFRRFTASVGSLAGRVRGTGRDGSAEHGMLWLAIQEALLPTLLCLGCILIGLIA